MRRCDKSISLLWCLSRRASSTAGTVASTATTASTHPLTGTIQSWHPFERRGEILGSDGKYYTIQNTRAFETVLPTMLRRLVGASVTFTVATTQDPSVSDRGIIRSRVDGINADSYKRPPPAVDLLAAFRVPDDSSMTSGSAAVSEKTSTATNAEPALEDEGEASLGHLPWMRKRRSPAHSRSTLAESAEAKPLAVSIVVNMATIPEPTEAEVLADADRHYLRDGIKPPNHIKDLRSATLLSADQLAKVRKLATNVSSSSSASSELREREEGLTAVDSEREPPAASSCRETLKPTIASRRDAFSRPIPVSPSTREEGSRTGDLTTAKAVGTVATTRVASSSPSPSPSGTSHASTPTVRRSCDGVIRIGTVVAWSALHRSGLIVDGEVPDEAPLPIVKDVHSSAFVIRSVEAFQTAMPSSLDMVRRKVKFVVARYSNLPSQSFAEQIEVLGDLNYATVANPAAASASKGQAQKEMKQKRLAAMVLDEGPLPAPTEGGGGEASTVAATSTEDAAPPEGAVYGILTRWSGGQGIIERSSGATYFVASAADFQQLVDQSSSAIRGAVVTFEVRPSRPRYAVNINVLSLAHSDIAMAKPLLHRSAPAADAAGGLKATVPPEGSETFEGFLVSWSPAEGQGVIQGDDGVRYLLRDAEENVVQYESVNKALLKKGRRVKYCRFGSNRLLAFHVEPLDAEADAEALRLAALEKQPPKVSIDGNVDEAIASPMSTSYWMGRLEKAGFDVSEVKNRQKSVVPHEYLDEKDDPLLDTQEVFKKDRWFNDKDRNIKIPGSDLRIGDMAQVAPSAMMNLAANIKDPVKLDKLKNKYFNQLTEEMKEHAWTQAKEMAPRYAKRIREAAEKGEEPTFHFY